MDVLHQRSKKECSQLSVHVDAIKPCVFSRSTKNTMGTGESHRTDSAREITCLHPSQWNWNPMSHQPKNQLKELNSKPDGIALLKGKVGRCPHDIRLGSDFLATTPRTQTKDQSRTRQVQVNRQLLHHQGYSKWSRKGSQQNRRKVCKRWIR